MPFLGMLPPRAANRRADSRSINERSPSFTKSHTSLMPVSFLLLFELIWVDVPVVRIFHLVMVYLPTSLSPRPSDIPLRGAKGRAL